MALLLSLLVSAATFSPVWHAALRAFISWQASSRGWNVNVGSIEGGLLDATVLYDVRCRKAFPAPTANDKPGGVDLRIARFETVFAWQWPFRRRKDPGLFDRLTLDGVTGTMDFTSAGESANAAAAIPETASLTPAFALKLWPVITAPPADFELLRVHCRLRRGPVILRVSNARLTAYREGPGQFLAHQIGISGPGFENTLADRSAVTAWKDGQLTVANLALGKGLDLVRITVDGARLRKRQLDWESELHALGGSVRSQGTVRFAHGRIGLDVAGSFQQVAVRPLARMLGVDGATDGTVDQGQFSFRGDPEEWTQATISLAGQATDFRWRQRRWESLDLAAIVLHERITVRKMELRQSRNQLSVSGECPLPANGVNGRWTLAGFACQVDAKLDDLHSLAELYGPGLPDVSGRMSVNGALTARSQGDALDGYLNVEGSALSISGAPLDYLRSTLLFQGEDLQVADVQATRGTDSISGKGTVRIFGGSRYQGELHASVSDLAIYHPAYAGILSPEPLQGMLHLDWSGDGAPGAHSGAFRGSVADFVAKSGPAHFTRPITFDAEGSYSPESISFRRLALKEGVGDKQQDAIKFEGAIPWTRDPATWNAGRRLDFSRPLAVRVAFNEAPLDLIAEAMDAPGFDAAEGQVGGWLDVSGTPEAPHANGVLQFRQMGLRWKEGAAIEKTNADVRLEDSLLRIDKLTGQRSGADWQMTGTVDLHQPVHPLLDLSAKTARVTSAVDNDVLHADAEIALSIHGPWQQAEIAGEVRLLDPALRQHLELATPGEDDGWSALAGGLPPAWRDDRLTLHVTAATPVRSAYGGELIPDVLVTGTGAAPQLSGSIELRNARIASVEDDGSLVESGTISLSAEQKPTVQLAMSGGNVLLGPIDALQLVRPIDELDASEFLRQATETPLGDAAPVDGAPPLSLQWR